MVRYYTMDNLDIYGGRKMKTRFSRVFCFVLALLLVPMGYLQLVIPVSAAYENTYVNTGDQRADILGVALTQVGYREGSGGYTKYGAWYGSSYMAWCGAFVSWCAAQANIPTSVLQRTGYARPDYFGLSEWFDYSSGRTPQPGDLFFRIEYDSNNNVSWAHVGLVYYVQGEYFYTLEGNTHDGSYVDGVYIRQRRLSGSFRFASPQYRNTSGHTHNYEVGVESAHPHKEYRLCDGCGDKYYTGNSKTLPDCITCKQENCSHSYGDYTKSDSTYHKATCSLCEKVSNLKHDWVDGEIIKEATCKDTGLKSQSCKQCSATREVTIPVSEEHTFTTWQYVDGENHHMVCEACGEEEEAAHIQSEERATDELSHWYLCEDCGGRLHHADHDFAGDCESACKECGYRSAAGHMYGTTWQTSETSHWLCCLECGATKDNGAHKFSSDCDGTCDTCGYVRQTAHTYDNTWKTNSAGHWRTCKVCYQNSPVQAHEHAADVAAGQAVYCVDCGYEMASAAAHIHEYVINSHDQKGHYGACACGAVLASTSHTWNPQTSACSACAEPVPAVGAQSGIVQFVVEKVGVTPYLWLVFVLPVVAVLAVLLLIVLLLVTIRNRSRNFDDEDFYDEEDGLEEPEAEKQPEAPKDVKEESGMEPLSIS